MTTLILGWLASHWLLVAAVVVTLAAVANPALVWKLKAWILLAVVLWWGWTGHAAYDRLAQQVETDKAYAAAQVATARATASEMARSEEQSRAAAVNLAASQYERGKRDAQAAADRVAGQLRAGNLRLRHEIRALAARVPGDPGAAGKPADAAERGAELAGAAVGVGAQCDAVQRALIDAYDAARGTP